MATLIFSWESSKRRTTFTPKGRFVSFRIPLILSLISSGVQRAVAKTPNPPALLTSATSLMSVIQFMPASIIGCSMPNSSVIRVFNILNSFLYLPLKPGLRFSRNAWRPSWRSSVMKQQIDCTFSNGSQSLIFICWHPNSISSYSFQTRKKWQ